MKHKLIYKLIRENSSLPTRSKEGIKMYSKCVNIVGKEGINTK